MAVLFLILVMSFRYEIHLPFFKIRPSVPPPISTTSISTEAIQESIATNNSVEGVLHHHSCQQRTLTLGRICSQVETIERIQDSSDDYPENSLSPFVIEELSGSSFCSQEQVVTETNTSLVIPKTSEDAPEEGEKMPKVLEKCVQTEHLTILTTTTSIGETSSEIEQSL